MLRIPLLLAWFCCSLVGAGRKEARLKPADWGGHNPHGMAAPIRSVATADDGQMVEDVMVAGAGAAMICPHGEAGLPELANVCDTMFFSDDPQAPTYNAITRHAARVIIERAKMMDCDVSDEVLDRARPADLEYTTNRQPERAWLCLLPPVQSISLGTA